MFYPVFNKPHILWLGFLLPITSHSAPITPYTLGEVNVLAQADLNDPDANVSQQQIREQGHTNIADASSDLAGINLTTSGSRGETMVQVRGFDMRETPIFIDGIPVYVPYDGNVDLGRFTTFDLAAIDVAKGFSSSVYGANAVGGAINLVSRKPQKAFEGELGGSLVFNDKVQLDGYNSYLNLGTKQQYWYMQLGLSYLDNDTFTLSDDFTPTEGQASGRRNNSYNEDKKVNIKVGYTPNETDEYSFNYINQQAEKGSAPYAGSDSSYSLRYWQWPEWDKESYYLISKTTFGAQQLKMRAYHDIFKNSLSSYNDSNYDSQSKGYAFNSQYDDYTNGASIEFAMNRAESSQTTLIAQYKEDVHRETDDDDPQLTFKDKTYTLGIENTTSLSPKLTLISGLSQHWLKGKQAESYQDGQIGEFEKADSGITNMQVGLFLQQTKQQQWHATFARKSRFPTLKDRYSFKLGSAIANPNLKAEIANHYELGLQDVWGEQLLIGSNLFFADVDDLIQSQSIDDNLCTSSPCSQMVNIGKVYRYGVELNMKLDVSDTLLLSANYTWLQQENRSNDDKFTDTPEHAAMLTLAWEIDNNVDLLVSERMESGRNSDSEGERTTAGFATTDLRLAYRYKDKTDMALKLGNLFDTFYAYQEGWPEPGRTIEISINRKF